MPYACIDIGSNTTRLLVAELRDGRVRELAGRRAYNRLGKDLRSSGRIPESKVTETAEVVAHQARVARDLGVEQPAVVATAAVRLAANRDDLREAIDRTAAVEVDVLSDEEEARLAFVGASGGLGAPCEGPVAVVDIGGGSSEVAVGEIESGVRWWTSIPVGSGSVTDTYLRSDPPTEAELRAARAEVAEAFATLRPPQIAETLAVGGTARSVKKLVGRELDSSARARALELLATTPAAAIARRFGIHPERAQLLAGGALVLDALVGRLGSRITVAQGGLREGVVLALSSGQYRAAGGEGSATGTRAPISGVGRQR